MSKQKDYLHDKNRHRAGYNFEALTAAEPALKSFVIKNPKGESTIDFKNEQAVKALNAGLLKHHYGLSYWDIPEGYLCPGIPGRAEYVHHIGDLLRADFGNKLPKGGRVRGIDVGLGANAAYPLIGNAQYGWHFVGSDVDDTAIANAQHIIAQNPSIKKSIQVRKQANPNLIFKNIIQDGERFDFTMCNPPFHQSAAAANASAQRKNANLSPNTKDKSKLSFGGRYHELWYDGGEIAFIQKMAQGSKLFSHSCLWFTTLVSKEENLKKVDKALVKAGAEESIVMEIETGNKLSRIVAWSFFNAKQRKAWADLRWS